MGKRRKGAGLKSKSSSTWSPIILGFLFGSAIGIAMDNVFSGMAIGLVLGIAVSVALSAKSRKKN
jgi:hypothetical protein